MRWFSLPFVILACLACAPATPDAELDVSGDWTETWECAVVCTGEPDETITGLTSMTLTQDGTDVERVDGDGTTWTGTLNGSTLTTTTMDGYEETSVFEFVVNDDETTDEFTITSEYTDADCAGDCTGSGERD